VVVLQNIQTSSGAKPSSYLLGRGSYPKAVTFPTHLHLLPRLSISGAVPPLPDDFMVCIGKTLPTSYTGCSKIFFAPDDYSAETSKNIFINTFKHLL
jgi:hypothetical protein